jgi:hypothetical protein
MTEVKLYTITHTATSDIVFYCVPASLLTSPSGVKHSFSYYESKVDLYITKNHVNVDFTFPPNWSCPPNTYCSLWVLKKEQVTYEYMMDNDPSLVTKFNGNPTDSHNNRIFFNYPYTKIDNEDAIYVGFYIYL